MKQNVGPGRSAAGLAVAAVLLAGGCSASNDADDGASKVTVLKPVDVAAEETLSSIDGETVRGGTDYDYDVASSVSGVAEHAQQVILGTVISWEDGRAVQDGDDLSKSAVVGIQVEDSYLPGSAAKTVFVEVQRGGVLVDKAGDALELTDGSRFNERSVNDLQRAVPIGTRVLALTVEAPADHELAMEAGQRVVTSWTPKHEGAELLSPLPQGLLFEDSDGTYVSGVAEQSDVEFGDWPASQRSRMAKAASPFDLLVGELSNFDKG